MYNSEIEKVYLNILLEETNNDILKKKAIHSIKVEDYVEDLDNDEINKEKLKKQIESIKKFIERKDKSTVFNALKSISSHLKSYKSKLEEIFNVSKDDVSQNQQDQKKAKRKKPQGQKKAKIKNQQNNKGLEEIDADQLTADNIRDDQN